MKSKLLLFCILLLISSNLSAIEMRLGETYLVESNKFNEDYFSSAERIEFSGEANDFYGFADEQVNFSGLAKLAVFSASEYVDISGIAGNGIKAIGRSITLKGKTTGTSFLGGEKVTFEPESETIGDTFVGARKVLVNGKITGDFYAGAGEVSIQNEIFGNVQARAGKLMISEQGKIHGNLTYYSDYELSAEEAARVSGNITFEKKEGGFHDTFADSDDDYGPFWLSLLFKLAFAILGFLVLLFPATRVLEREMSGKEVLSSSLWGLIPIFVYPSAFVISILLIITIPLAIAMLLSFVPLLFLTKIIGITLLGGLIARSLNMRINNRFMYFLMGIVLYSLLSLIPFFGFLLMVFVSSIGCGIILFSLFQKKFV